MTETLFLSPDKDCSACRGTGEIIDYVPYGSTNVPMTTLCDCIEEQIPEDKDDWDVVIERTK